MSPRVPVTRLLDVRGSPAHERDRRRRRAAVRHERRRRCRAGLATPIRTTSVSTDRASRAQSTLDSRLPASSWPVTTANDEATPRWVSGMPAYAGSGDGRADAGDDLERDPGPRQRLGLLAAPAEDERIAALEPHDPPPAPRVQDQERVDLLLRQRVVARGLAGEDAPRAAAPRRGGAGARAGRRRRPGRAAAARGRAPS